MLWRNLRLNVHASDGSRLFRLLLSFDLQPYRALHVKCLSRYFFNLATNPSPRN